VALNQEFSLDFSDGRVVSGAQYMDNVTIAGFTVCSLLFANIITSDQ
jgi:hypothetical protein